MDLVGSCIFQSDGLQWLIDEAYATKDAAQLEPHRIAHRLLIVNDVSFLSTSATLQNLLLDLASSDPSRGYMQALRDECDQVLGLMLRQMRIAPL